MNDIRQTVNINSNRHHKKHEKGSEGILTWLPLPVYGGFQELYKFRDAKENAAQSRPIDVKAHGLNPRSEATTRATTASRSSNADVQEFILAIPVVHARLRFGRPRTSGRASADASFCGNPGDKDDYQLKQRLHVPIAVRFCNPGCASAAALRPATESRVASADASFFGNPGDTADYQSNNGFVLI